MPRFIARCAALAALAALLVSPAVASASGGSNIASATTVTFGQQEFGNTSVGKYGDCYPATYWNLPLGAGDEVTIDWETSDSRFAEHLHVFPAGTTDFSINNVESLDTFELGVNNKAESRFTVGTAGVYPFLIHGSCEGTGGPVDFTATVHHELITALQPYPSVNTNSIVVGTASLANGLPAPDGLGYALTVTWPGGGSAISTGVSVGGSIAFQLGLPAGAAGKKATFTVTRPADASFQAAKSVSLTIPVAALPPTPPAISAACAKATTNVHALARQFRRLRTNVGRAHGRTRRFLQHRKRGIGHKLAAAKARAATACG